MVKKCFQVLTLFMLTLCTFSLFAQDVYAHYDIYDYYSDYEYDFSDVNIKVSEFDYVFVGKPTKLIETVKINVYGFDEVYSLYEVKITNQLKGNIESKKVNILYFGGICDETLYISDPDFKTNSDKVPEIGKSYMFSCNQYEEFKPDYLDYKDVYYIYNPYSMIYLGDFISILPNLSSIYQEHYDAINYDDGDIIEFYVFDSVQTTSPINLEGTGDDEGNGGGTEIGTYFDNAIEFTFSQTITCNLSANEDKYYKFTLSNYNYELVTFHSFIAYQTYYVTATLYDGNLDEIQLFDNHNDSLSFDTEIALRDETFYLKISSDQVSSGSVNFKVYNPNNCYCKNDPDDLLLILNYSAVMFNSLIITDLDPLVGDRTSYINELIDAIAIWNALDYISISYLEYMGVSNVYVYDIDEAYNPYPAMFTPVLNTIYFNTAIMDSWTFQERLKTVAHELGHALGLNEFNSSGSYQTLPTPEDYANIMRQGKRSFISLGPCDILVYNYKWGDL